MPEVRLVTKADVGELAQALARAFYDDPVSIFIFPDEALREARLTTFFKVQVSRTFLRRGEGYTTDLLQGAAFWMLPTSGKPGFVELVEQLALIPLMGRRLFPTARLLALMESHHPKQPHYYLGTLGTDPQWQGKGVGSALLAPVLEHCDAEGVPAYLESSKESNVSFYRRHGFDVTGEVNGPDGGPRLWLMWREPLGRR